MRHTLAAALIGLAASIAPLGAGDAMAGLITRTYDFSFGNFVFAGVAPVDPVTGRITVTFDPVVDQAAKSPDYFSSNLPAAYLPVVFTYDSAAETLVFGNNCAGISCSVHRGFDEFAFVVTFSDPDALVPTTALSAFIGAAANQQTLTPASDVSLSVVPEPATLALLGFGLAGLAAARRRRG